MIIKIVGFGIILCPFLYLIIDKTWSKHKTTRDQQEKIAAFQKKHRLSENDLKLFKETMGELKEQILTLEKNVQQVKDLKEIEGQTSGVKSAKEIFKELMKDPQDMTYFDHFLYQKMPSAVEISEKVLQIKKNKIETPEIQKALQEILETFAVVLESVTDDYEEIIINDSKEIALTKKMMEKKHG